LQYSLSYDTPKKVALSLHEFSVPRLSRWSTASKDNQALQPVA
jgi:hypothetical protein